MVLNPGNVRMIINMHNEELGGNALPLTSLFNDDFGPYALQL